jgi:hypothetical protein
MDIRDRIKAKAQKNTLLQVAQANAETKTCKRVFFSPTRENFFPTLPFLIKLFFKRMGFVPNRTDIASNVNRFGQSVCELQATHLRTDRRASANIGFASGGVTCFVKNFVYN